MEKKDGILNPLQPQEENEDDDDEGIKNLIHLRFPIIIKNICSWKIMFELDIITICKCSFCIVLDEMVNELESDAPSSKTSSDEEEADVDEPEEEGEGWLPFYLQSMNLYFVAVCGLSLTILFITSSLCLLWL